MSDWHYPPELPEEGEAVLVDQGNNAVSLMECSYQHEAECRVWTMVYPDPEWDDDRKLWRATDGYWDDDYTVRRWHRYPDPKEKGDER